MNIAIRWWGLAAVLPMACGATPYPLHEDFEAGLGAWTTNGTWGLTTMAFVSPNHSAADSPGSYYTNDTDAALALSGALDLSAAVRPAVGFQLRHYLEADYDFARVELSTNAGSSWLPLRQFTGTQQAWRHEQLSLADYAGAADVRLRVRIVTDGSVVMDGLYLDDVAVGEAPAGVSLVTGVVTTTSASLSWSASADPAFRAYRLYRAFASNVDVNASVLVAEFTDAAVTSATDVAVSPKSTYYYALQVVNSNDLGTLSAAARAATPAGMDFPFLDNGEGGSGTWVADAPWALGTNAAYSASHAWSDSPDASYSNNLNAAITLSAPLSLVGARNPVLTYAHGYGLLAGDTALVELSTNNGAGWLTLDSATAASSDWRRARHSLSAYTNAAQVLARFRLTTDAGGVADGWHVDDIAISESPDVVPAPVLDQVSSHSMRINWATCTNTAFSNYAILRSTNTGVGINATLAGIVSDRATTSLVDSNLALDTLYYYRVYAVNPWGAYSADSVAESSARTLNHPLPFADDFEGSLTGWNHTGLWGVQTNASGGFALTDSPNTVYSNNLNVTVSTAVDLRDTAWPVLRFKDRFELAAGDWVRVEISAGGFPTYYLYGVYAGTRTNWEEQTLDLSIWKGAANVQIVFRLASNNDGVTGDGWFIDDVKVEEHVSQAVSFPFYDRFEDGLTNWIGASWRLTTNNVYAGAGSALDAPAGIKIAPDAWYLLNLGGELNLTGAVNPRVTYWVKGSTAGAYPYTHHRFQVSTDGGKNWTDLVYLSENFTNTTWTRQQVNVTAYRATNTRFRVGSMSAYGSAADGDLQVDNLAIEEVPSGVSLDAPVPHLKSVELSWTMSGIGPAFQRYELYRSPDATVNLSDLRIGQITNIDTLAFTDTGLSIGATYTYGIFVVNTNDTYSDVNTRPATTVPITPPFTDGMDNLDNWDRTGTWGPDFNIYFSGTASLCESPNANYGNNTNIYMLTAVDLRDTAWPVLKFKDRFELAAGDWVRVEISAGGYPTYYFYGVHASTRTNWEDQILDLSMWKGAANVQIVFRLASNNDSVTGDGWFIDDVKVEEHVSQAVSYPFYDRFEDGLTNWMGAAWRPTSNSAYAGAASALDAPAGIQIAPDAWYLLNLGGELNLTGAVNPRVTYWVKGRTAGAYPYTHHRFQVSTDGGKNWVDLVYLSESFTNTTWTRQQANVTAYRATNTRFRVASMSAYSTAADGDLQVDNLAIEEAPPGVSLDAPVPHLKSVELTWAMSGIGPAFQRYELYRSVDATVNLNDTRIAQITNINTLAFLDTGLSIGATYYYGIFVVNTNDTYSDVNTRPATTVPITIPFSDVTDNLDNWDRTGTWGADSNIYFSGTASLNDSPNANYGNNINIYMLTAVDLRDTAWPVLRFKDRFEIAAGDWVRVEISASGYPTYYFYGVYASTRTNWEEQILDLSMWKGAANVQIVFRLVSNNDGVTGDGWFVDDVKVEEHAPQPLSYPFYDRFEDGLTHWMGVSWRETTNGAFAGARTALDAPAGIKLAPDAWYLLNLGGELDLTGAVNPRVTYWVKGSTSGTYPYTHHRFQVSTDGGRNWVDLVYLSEAWTNTIWTRQQVNVTAYRTTNTRFRVASMSAYSTAADGDLQVDNVSIEEAPPAVTLYPPVPSAIGEMALTWTAYTNADFQFYRLYRATASGVGEGSICLGTFTNTAITNFTDSGLQARSVYFYKLYVSNTNDTSAGSSEASARTLGVPLGWTDDGESLQPAWTRTGAWTNLTGVGRNGSSALVDSPADYAVSSDYYLQTAVDLTTAQWPVLKFWDRFSLNNGDWIAVDVAPEGAGWTRLYGAYASARTNWQEQVVDLSPWKGYASVNVRFHLPSDGGTPGDGWYLDDVFLGEHQGAPLPAPFFEDFEQGLSHWLAASWTADPADPYAGSGSARDSGLWLHAPEVYYYLTLAHGLDLSATTNPVLTMLVRGRLANYASYRVQVSTNGGIQWAELPAFNLDYGFDSPWIRKQASLTAYRGTNVRVRCTTYSYWGSVPDNDFFVDNVGIGEGDPGAPVLSAPAPFGSVGVLRPLLTVTNAIDYQSDPLTFQFEVYGDAALQNLVAQVPAVAGGLTTTTWQVGVNLADNAQYWWRCRASDGTNAGAWMTPASFFVNETNASPFVVQIAGPPKGATLRTASGILSWYPDSDPDVGDAIAQYHLQVDEDPAFTSPIMDTQFPAPNPTPTGEYVTIARPLASFAGWQGLGMITNYYWRVRAQDSRFAWSPWTAGGHWFIYGVPAPDLGTFRRNANGSMTCDWAVGTENWYVYWSPALTSATWQVVAGPVGVNTWTFTPLPGSTQGFYRVSGE